MPEFEVIAGDMFDEIGCVEPASCRCVLIDPPYMIGTQSVHRDNMIDPWADMMNGARFYREVIDAVWRGERGNSGGGAATDRNRGVAGPVVRRIEGGGAGRWLKRLWRAFGGR